MSAHWNRLRIALDLLHGQPGRTRGPHAASKGLKSTLSWPPCRDGQPPCRARIGILVAPKAHLHPGVSSPPQSPIPGMSAGVRSAYALESDRWTMSAHRNRLRIATDLAHGQVGRTRGPHAASKECLATLSWPRCGHPQPPCRARIGILVAPKAHLHPGVSSPPQSPIPEVSA